MERNWDMIRDILTRLEQHSEGPISLSDFPDEDPILISYHAKLLLEANLVNGQMVEAFGEIEDFSINRMTWEGHEFLDAIRNKTVWKKITKEFSDKGVSMTFDLIKSASKTVVSSMVKSFLN